jgi:glycosyltransferase involved in cell wall biosynthesis
MKIVHVVYSLEMGGAESLVAQLCRLQRANGHTVTIAAYSKLGTLGETLRGEGFRIDVLGTAPVPRTMLRYLSLLRNLRPDVVHCHNPAPTLQAAVGARLAGASSVISTRHSLVAPPFETAAEIKYNLISWFCDWVVGICDATCNNLRHTPLARKKRIIRVYNGAERLSVVPPEERPQRSGFTLVFVGRLAKVKDLSTLVNAIALALPRVPDLHLWVVGDGPERGPLEALAAKLEISANVVFWGERHDVARFFSSADVFTMSSVSEGLPMSLLQAMSVGLPAIVTDVGGMAEVVRNADCGLRVPVGDSAEYAEAIVQLATDPARRNELAANASHAYNAGFTLEQMDAAYMKLYQTPR